jgi:methylmalonyl-CoA mutase
MTGCASSRSTPKAEPVPHPTREHGRWRVAQRVEHPDPEEANLLALADLNGGADSLTLVMTGAPAARGFGVRAESADDLDRALSGVMLDLVHLRLDAGGHGWQAAATLLGLIERRGHDLGALDLDLGLDPIGAMAATGALSARWPVVAGRCADTLASLQDRGFRGRAFLCDGRPYHEAGASEGQELAAVLATGVAYLRALDSGGHALDPAREALAFLLVADADEFLTIAKFRALRRLWARVEVACGLDPKPIRLHAETAWRMTTRRDPWMNLLRGTMACFSAGIGGADCIGVLPSRQRWGFRRVCPTPGAQHAADPAGRVEPLARRRSGGRQRRLRGVDRRALREGAGPVQAIEREGGIIASLESGALQARIGEVRRERERAVATRADAADRHERVRASGRSARERASSFPPEPEEAVAHEGTTSIDRLAASRAAEPFEALRDRADAILARTGLRPRVFLAGLGPPSSFAPHAAFARNAFEAGGFETWGNEAAPSPAEIVEAGLAWLALDADKRVCLCGSTEAYARDGAAVAGAFRNAGATFIAVAGRADELDSTFDGLGASAFVFTGCDILALLHRCIDIKRDR